MQDATRDTVLEIYDTVADPSLWPDTLQRLAGQIDAVGCIVFEWQGLPHERDLVVPVASSFYDPDQIKTYVDRFFDEEARNQDVFEAHSLMSDKINLIQDDVLAPSLEELKALKNVETLQKLGILHRAAGLLNKDNSAQARFSVQLGVDRGRMTDAEQNHMGRILPHVAKAFDLGRPAKQLASEHGGLLAAMDRLTIGVCVLDPKGNRVIESEEFRRQRDAYRVFRITPNGALNHGRFGARPRKEAIAADQDVFLCVEVAPLHRSGEIGSTAFGGYIVYSSDTSLPLRCQTLPIKLAYGLTDAELSLVDAIAQGLTNAQIAERRAPRPRRGHHQRPGQIHPLQNTLRHPHPIRPSDDELRRGLFENQPQKPPRIAHLGDVACSFLRCHGYSPLLLAAFVTLTNRIMERFLTCQRTKWKSAQKCSTPLNFNT